MTKAESYFRQQNTGISEDAIIANKNSGVFKIMQQYADYQLKNTTSLKEKLIELSLLSRETKGASFAIQHNKETGLFKVNFLNNYPDGMGKNTEFEQAIDNAIKWITKKRRRVEVSEHYTLTKQYKT